MQWFVGTAGWTVPKQHQQLFSAEEGMSHLQRYASRFRCAEINSSFYRPHRRSTWERWAAVTPSGFRFAVKAPKAVTHTGKLLNAGAALLEFFSAVSGLGAKLGPVLVQLPPKLAFDAGVAQEFFSTLRELHSGAVALEPRHASWFGEPVDALLRGFEVARVAADPPAGSPQAAQPGGWPGLRYWRLHGAPQTYYSAYSQDALRALRTKLQRPPAKRAAAKPPSETWVIFDNTALGHAAADAAQLAALLTENATAAIERRPRPTLTTPVE